MRIFRLSDEFFPTVYDVYKYLIENLRNQNYFFYEVGGGKVAENTIQEGDIVLFSYKYDIIASGILDGGRIPSDDDTCKYMYKFKPFSLKMLPLGININELHSFLKLNGVDVGKPFVPRQDWPLIDNTYAPLVICWIKLQLCKYYESL